MAKIIRITGIEGALKLIKNEPWYTDYVGTDEVFTVAFEDKRAYIVEEYHGSVIKEDAEVIENREE